MRGGGRFGSDYKRRLAADMAKKKTEKFSSPPAGGIPSPTNIIYSKGFEYLGKTIKDIQLSGFPNIPEQLAGGDKRGAAFTAVMGVAGAGGKGKGITTSVRTIGPTLAREVSGISARRRDLVNTLLQRGAGISSPSTARKVTVDTFNTLGDVAENLGPRMVSTARQKSMALRDDLYNTVIDNKTLSEHMDDAGLGLFKSFDDMSEEAGDAVIGMVRPVLRGTQEAVNESLDVMQRMNPSGVNIASIKDPIAREAQHIWENDHAASGSVGKQIIIDSASEILRGGGKLSDDWFKASDDLLSFVDDPQNLRAVTRWWNQAKSNKHPEQVMRELNTKFPALAKHMRGPNMEQYLDYVVNQWQVMDDIARNIEGAADVLGKAGGLARYASGVKSGRPF